MDSAREIWRLGAVDSWRLGRVEWATEPAAEFGVLDAKEGGTATPEVPAVDVPAIGVPGAPVVRAV